MKKQGQIVVTIDTDGSTVVKVEGCPGKTCERLTADLEAALGSVKKNVRTQEFYETEKDQRVRQT